MLRILNLPLAHNHNPLCLVTKSDCNPLQCNLLLIRELPRSFASGSLAAAGIIKFLYILPSFAQLNVENGKRSHRIGKFNILSVNVILFRGNQKNIRVGLSGRKNAASGLSTKKYERFPDYQGD